MMITEIGIVAGEIWHHLDENGETNFLQLKEHIEKPDHLILMSLGWLAREGYVIVYKLQDDYKIVLRKGDE